MRVRCDWEEGKDERERSDRPSSGQSGLQAAATGGDEVEVLVGKKMTGKAHADYNGTEEGWIAL